MMRRINGPACAVIVAAVLGLGVAACGGSSSTASNAAATNNPASSASGSSGSHTPFRVLGFYPVSGSFEVSGIGELDGLKAAANVINSEGGILGHEVVIKIDDDQNVGTTAIAAAQSELASGTKYNLIIPGIAGTTMIPLASLFEHTQVPQVSPGDVSTLDQPSKYPNFFMTLNGFSANEQGVVDALKARGITKAAFISGDDPDGQDAAKFFASSAKAAGISVTASVLVPNTAVDAKPQYQQVLASNPQAVVIGAFSNAEPVILVARAALGSAVPLYLDSFAAAFPMEAALKQPAQLKGIMEEQFPYLVKGSPAESTAWFKTFLAAYTKLLPHPVLNLIAGVVSYNALMVARAAAIKAGSVDGPAMIKALGEISSASQVPDFVGDPSTGIFSATTHQLDVKPSNYGFYPAGPTLDGVLVPGS